MDEYYQPRKTVCDSGLTVITMRIPGKEGLIAGEVAVKVGAAHARKINPRLIGIPHCLEHLTLFGRSRHYPPRHVNNTLPEDYALQHNAATSYLCTKFFRSGNGHVVPSELFWEAFEKIIDGTFFPEIDRETWDIELKRIFNEIKTVVSPETLDILALDARMHGLPFMRECPTGTIEQLNGYTRAECLDFHQNYYTLSNTCIVLTGDVDHNREVAQAEAFLADVPTGPAIPLIDKGAFQSGEFRKASNFPENAGCLRVTLV